MLDRTAWKLAYKIIYTQQKTYAHKEYVKDVIDKNILVQITQVHLLKHLFLQHSLKCLPILIIFTLKNLAIVEHV